MIPIKLSLSGFLSYCDPVELDLTALDLACISGPNGAGKSSLLDAITWVLFGQARKRDDSIINAQSKLAEVSLVFAYENNIYRVTRSKPRDKTTSLEFQILQNGDLSGVVNGPLLQERLQSLLLNPTWKPLTERIMRDTDARIQQTLRLDYDTFVNASFFLQGKADQFTQQPAADRKRILSSILGLEVWETYRKRAAESEKEAQGQITNLDGRLQEINAELAEESQRKTRLAQLEAELERYGNMRSVQEDLLARAREIAASLAGRQALVDTLGRQCDVAAHRLEDLRQRLSTRRQEQQTYTARIERAADIEAAYRNWQSLRTELERWDTVAGAFRQHEKRRLEPLEKIASERASLQQELRTLQSQQAEAVAVQQEADRLQPQILAEHEACQQIEAKLALRTQYESDLQAFREQMVDTKSENQRLKAEMEELKERIDRLTETEGAVCPLCGQPLAPEDRSRLIEELRQQGKDKGDRFRTNQADMKFLEGQVSGLSQQVAGLTPLERDFRIRRDRLAQLSSRAEIYERQLNAWAGKGLLRLQTVAQALEQDDYAYPARQLLATVDTELKAIGYDAELHDSVRAAEQAGRSSEADLLALEQARAVLAPLSREITDLEKQIGQQQGDFQRQQQEHQSAADALAIERAHAPDLDGIEESVRELKGQENRLRMDVGAARQKVAVLEDLKKYRQSLEAQREAYARQVSRYKQLQRAFGKDGVPALLIEQALPEIEGHANEILDRLSGGSMSVKFITQAEYKTRREDLRETLEIRISDGMGARDYEMFSGGEAFRVNFAIRLALSQVLAQRAGARLQTLVIDEGFGSQDALGRQRLIEAINLVRSDFAKILVITHIDELKEAFPYRIEVEKTERGSKVKVI